MRRTATSIRVLVSASVLLVVLGAYPAAAGTHSPTGSLGQQGLAAFEWYRLSQANANVSDERLWSLRRDGFTAVYADIGRGSRRPTSRRAGASGGGSGGWPATASRASSSTSSRTWTRTSGTT